MYDIIIIGAGPAGISAGLYAKRLNTKVLILDSGKSILEKAIMIDNYYGFPGGINGVELYQKGMQQAKELQIELKEAEVVGIENLGNVFKIKINNEYFESKSLILSTGNKKIRPEIRGIEEFEGKGISYCAICDGFFYKNKNIAVIGNGKFAINEAKELANIAKELVILTDGGEKPECDFKVITKKIQSIEGESKAEKIKFEDDTVLNIDGIFIAYGEAGAIQFAKTLGIIQKGDIIKVNENMETNVKGIYACGNITGGLQQICKAVYEGAVAGISAANYVRKT